MAERMAERMEGRMPGRDGARAPAGAAPEPPDGSSGDDALRQALLRALAPHPGGVVLAVSGGMDSMALLHAAARWAPRQVVMVATFDHGSGAHAAEAAALVATEARRLGLAVVRERGRELPPTEAAWRAARWAFLRRVAKGCRAPVATAHTRDDQVETVFQRLLRGSGARGLAGLAAPSAVVRPWLALPRAAVRAWGAAEGVPSLEDPANTDRRYQRVRMRLDWLPAAERVDPGVGDWLVALGERAAAWRREVEALVDALGVEHGGRRLRVPAAPLRRTSAAGRAVLWQALAGRVGVPLDAAGTRALVGFTTGTRRGAQLQLAGGGRVLCLGEGGADWFEVRAPGASRTVVPWDGDGALPPRAGGFRFRRVAAGTAPSPDSPWEFPVPVEAAVRVRPWRPGDRIRTAGAPAGRRVTRYLAEARIPAADRPAWPVVLLDGAVAWIPGICRSLAAPPRPGWSAPTWYRCELLPD
jgi:tRNA(Ile)-lysidine synthase